MTPPSWNIVIFSIPLNIVNVQHAVWKCIFLLFIWFSFIILFPLLFLGGLGYLIYHLLKYFLAFTVCLRLRSHDAGTFLKRWKMWRIGKESENKNTKTRNRHIFRRHILKTEFWPAHFENDICWYRVNASSNFATVTFFTVFKICQHRVNAVFVRYGSVRWERRGHWIPSLYLLLFYYCKAYPICSACAAPCNTTNHFKEFFPLSTFLCLRLFFWTWLSTVIIVKFAIYALHIDVWQHDKNII